MNTIINQNILNKENGEFFNEYIELLINRLTHSNMFLEHDLGEIDDYKKCSLFKR